MLTQRVCRKCGGVVRYSVGNGWKHDPQGNCTVVQFVRIPLKVIEVGPGPYDSIVLKENPISKRSRTLLHQYQTLFTLGVYNLFKHPDGFVVRSTYQIPKVCHATEQSAVRAIKRMIYRDIKKFVTHSALYRFGFQGWED